MEGKTYFVRDDVPMPCYEVVGAVVLADLVVSAIYLTHNFPAVQFFVSIASFHPQNILQPSSKTSSRDAPTGGAHNQQRRKQDSLNLQLLINRRNRKHKIPRIRQSMTPNRSQIG